MPRPDPFPYTAYTPHDGERLPRAERCCTSPRIEATWGMGNGENNIIQVWCSTCGHDFMSIWPKGSLEDDGWPKDWTRPPEQTSLLTVTPLAETVGHA